MMVFISVETPRTLKLQHDIYNAPLERVVRDVRIHLDDGGTVLGRVLRLHAGRQKDIVHNPLACLPSYMSGQPRVDQRRRGL